MSFLYLVAMGRVEPELVEEIARRLGMFLGVETRSLAPLPEPDDCYDLHRGQYSSVVMLRSLPARCPADALKLIALTERDLFIPMLSFVYGQAQLKGSLAIVSLARLRQEFYGLPGDRRVLMERAFKEVLHELGHTLGLTHCPDRNCAMVLSTSLGHLDQKRAEYCASCAPLVRESAGLAGRLEYGR